MNRLPDDFWTVNEDDERVSLAGLIAAFATFTLFLIAVFVYVLFAWSAT